MTVCVLLSTYNGAEFLAEQLESIASQSFADLTVNIRDDGSTDGTRVIIERYARADARFSCKFSSNIGAVHSYFELLREAGSNFNYFAFCDQDDVWECTKIARAVCKLAIVPEDTPALYFCRLDVVDRRLRHKFFSREPCRPLTIGNAAVENVATGCSLVGNRALLDLLRRGLPQADRIFMHDWWVYMVAAAFGHVVFDREVGVRYRQHGSNVLGLKHGLANLAADVTRMFTAVRAPRLTIQLAEFRRVFGNSLSFQDSAMIEDLIDNAGSRKLHRRTLSLLRGKYFRQSGMSNFRLAASILLNRL